MECKNNSIELPQNITERFLSSNFALGCVLLLACVLRIWHVLSLRKLPLFDRLIIDSEVYDRWAQYIAAGNWLGGDRAFFMDPLYPYVLAMLYKLFGHDLLVVRLFQVGLGVATCALVAFIGNRISGNKAAGTLAAFLVAIYGPAIFQEGEIEKTALGIFLITSALACAIQKYPLSCFFAGALLALASLTRGNLVLLLPLGALYFLFSSKRQTETGTPSTSIMELVRKNVTSRQARNTFAFILGGILTLTPVLVRNHHVSGEWILITSMSGQNFYTGNNPFNNVGAYRPLPFVRPQSLNEEADFHAKAESITGRTFTQGEVSSFWFQETLKHISDNPAYATLVFIRKFCLFWSNVEIADAWDMYFLKRYSPVLNLPLLNFGILMSLASIGAISSYKRYDGIRLLTGFIVAYSCTVIAFFIFSRYRIHVVPPLAILSAFGLLWAWDHIRTQHWQKILPHVFVAAAIYVFSTIGASSLGFYAREHVNSYTLLAEIYRMNGDFDSAEILLKDALQKFKNDPSPLQALGLVHLGRKDPKTALYYFNQGLLVNEEYPDAWFFFGLAHESIGNTSEALNAYRKQLEYIPNHESSIKRLSALSAAGN